MSLPENTSYFDYQPVLNAIKNVTRSLGQRRARTSQNSPTSYFKNLLGTVSGGLKKLGTISTPYGSSTRFEKVHPGVDVAMKSNTPLPFVASGKVAEVVSGKQQGSPGYGNYVVVVDDQGNKYRYSHLSRSYVSAGQRVNAGEVGMLSGKSGNVYSQSGGDPSHLDFRITDAWGRYVNPARFL